MSAIYGEGLMPSIDTKQLRPSIHDFPARRGAKSKSFSLFEDGTLDYVTPDGRVRPYRGVPLNLTLEMVALVSHTRELEAQIDALLQKA